ncbi:polyadenylate-binding protein RBP47C [Brassica rapa]|uniref:polyadenylate-binding protein RBP47C n=1 Tax=Brassica campestris TaxID=3711 RepID=UPI0004F19E2C|nr:polyadenylate-binding protein RBP47C [Brassica rapa]
MADTKVQSPETTAVEDNNHQRITSSSPTPPPPPSHWMGMRYPSPMMMPHHMMYPPPPYSPYHHHNHMYQHHHHQSRGNKHQNASNAENKTIWIGDLLHWMDENYLNSCFAPAGEMASVKVIRNKHTGLSEGYGFVEFDSHDIAEKVLQDFNGVTMLQSDQPYRLNWASFSTGEKRLENGPDHSIFVGDLAPEVTDELLHKLFFDKYPSVKTAKVVIDGTTGRSKGYGFVRFGDDGERSKALVEMNGVKCCSRAMRVGAATPRKPNGYQHQGGGAAPRDGDSLNTTIFVGGLDADVTDEVLRQPFAGFGEIVSVKIPVGKGCGFIQFVNRENAEEALEKLNGSVIGKQTVRLSWGRNQGNKQPRGGYGDQWVEPFYRGQYYNGYGYMPLPPPIDPRMYGAAPYGGYPMYGGHQQQQQQVS